MNPSLASLVADVYTLTNRPDLVGETTLAVRNATLKAHSIDYFYKDLYETAVMLDTSAAQQSIEYKQLIPRWRAAKYLRKYDPVCKVAGQLLELITPEEVLDSYSRNRENVYYVAGAELQVRSSEAQQYFILGCYLFPDVTVDGYSSWIATDQPTAILYEATATVFKTIGYDEQNASYKAMVAEEYAILKENNILAGGS